MPHPPFEVPPDQTATAEVDLRYEDIAQDGRPMLLALPHSIGLVVWQKILMHRDVTRAGARAGIVPVLTRLVVEGGAGPLSVRRPLHARGGYDLAHTVDAAGEVDRLILHTWVDLEGEIGRTHGPPPPDAGRRVPVGRVYGEHVFTRLFAPPDARKVLRFELDGVPPVPPARHVWSPPEDLLRPADGDVPLEPDLSPDEATVAFGLAHTDSNQHVNSLVYPRLFEEAALRRLAALGRPTRVLSRRLEIAYRKPFFAGDRARIRLRLLERPGALTAVGLFEPADDAARPHAFVRLDLAP